MRAYTLIISEMVTYQSLVFLSGFALSTITSLLQYKKVVSARVLGRTALATAFVWAYAATMVSMIPPLVVVSMTNCALNIALGAIMLRGHSHTSHRIDTHHVWSTL